MIVLVFEIFRFIVEPIEVIVAVLMLDELVAATWTTCVRAFATALCNAGPK